VTAPVGAGSAAELDLVRRCRLGSESAYAELIASVGRALFTLAVRLVGSPSAAEAVVRDTFVEAFRAVEDHGERLPLAPWLAGLCVRRARRRVGSGPLGRPLIGARPDRAGLSGPDLAACLAALPFEQRAVLALRFGMGLGADETALALGTDRVEVCRRVTGALAELRASEWGPPGSVGARHPATAAADCYGLRRFVGREEAWR
jgi:RNA polymerase sigma-70 factor (ECF subfamily)